MGKLVAISTSPFTTVWPAQRKTFYAAGRFWVFYCDGTDMVYCTSTDGINWTDPEPVRPAWRGSRFSIWFEERGDETFLHYAYSRASFNEPIRYRRGIPNEDGTITWSDGEEEAVAGVLGVAYTYPVISVDSEGYPWIGYCRSSIPNNYPYATRSANNVAPFWSGAEVKHQLSTVSDLYFVTVIPLTGGKMLALYSRPSQKICAKLWNGAWGSEISTINKVFIYYYFTAVAEGDDVHLVFTGTSWRLIYARYDYSSNSFTNEKSLLGVYFVGPPVISIDEDNNLLVFWGGYPEANTLYYMRYTAETDTWGPVVKWKSEEYLRTDTLSCFYKQNSGYTGLAYTTNPYPGPYEVKFNYVAPPPPPGVEAEPGEPGSPGAPEPTPKPKVNSNTLTSAGSRHTTPKEGTVGKSQSFKRTRIRRHITWLPVVITKA